MGALNWIVGRVEAMFEAMSESYSGEAGQSELILLKAFGGNGKPLIAMSPTRSSTRLHFSVRSSRTCPHIPALSNTGNAHECHF